MKQIILTMKQILLFLLLSIFTISCTTSCHSMQLPDHEICEFLVPFGFDTYLAKISDDGEMVVYLGDIEDYDIYCDLNELHVFEMHKATQTAAVKLKKDELQRIQHLILQSDTLPEVDDDFVHIKGPRMGIIYTSKRRFRLIVPYDVIRDGTGKDVLRELMENIQKLSPIRIPN